MARYASDTMFEGDRRSSWWGSTLWATHTAEAQPALSPENASEVRITRKDHVAIKNLLLEFLRAIRGRSEEALRATLTDELYSDFRRREGSRICAAIVAMNPDLEDRVSRIKVTSYDITRWGLTVEVEISFRNSGTQEILFGLYPTESRSWRITDSSLYLPGGDEESSDDYWEDDTDAEDS